MGKGSAQTLKEIERIREDLDRDIGELQERLPGAAVWAKRAAGVAVGGGVGMRMLRMMLKRRARKKGKGRPAVVHLTADGALAAAPAPAKGSMGAKLLWAAAGAGAGAAAMAVRDKRSEPTIIDLDDGLRMRSRTRGTSGP